MCIVKKKKKDKRVEVHSKNGVVEAPLRGKLLPCDMKGIFVCLSTMFCEIIGCREGPSSSRVWIRIWKAFRPSSHR